jgi:hypothetical protein
MHHSWHRPAAATVARNSRCRRTYFLPHAAASRTELTLPVLLSVPPKSHRQSLPMYRPPLSPHPRLARRALLTCTLAAAAGLAGCANPRELMTGSTGKSMPLAAWQTQAAPTSEAVRSLSEGEGELVIASAIAAHEMRRP